ncbi:hypothetical protein [Hansschlegelia sp.]|uniref:hypothetical protein n=1 Tax=Hansschlegelia sp. TaxID=2041892 RepID=UPI002BC2DDF6|nr:hypothetical protein [Hansschlegelia sp.]HVI27495.1 hypothetical protein [Hansschlegelia sp.]
MAQRIAARFKLHLRCENCLKESTQTFDIPDVIDAPTTVADLLESGALEHQPYACRECDSAIGVLIGVTTSKPGHEPDQPPRSGGRTVYVVQGFRRDRTGRLAADTMISATSEAAARRCAQRYEQAGGGAIATSQVTYPETGDVDPPVVLVQCGPVLRQALNRLTDAA